MTLEMKFKTYDLKNGKFFFLIVFLDAFKLKFWVGKTQNVIFLKFVIGGSGGVKQMSDSISGLVVKF